jgi:hypothetical protein
VRSLEEIARKSRETAGEIGKVGSGLLRLRRAAGVLERVRRRQAALTWRTSIRSVSGWRTALVATWEGTLRFTR